MKKGYDILKNGGSALDAVTEAVVVLEDYPLFNAGKGAVFTSNGENELNASIMDGGSLKAGAVGCAQHIKNPIKLAKTILEKSSHLLLVGQGAEEFAKDNDIEMVNNQYFYVEHRYQQHLNKKGKMALDHDSADDSSYSTVGAVALDINGNLAAGTSTGGIVNKKHGRVGDSSLIGSGTYANNDCAVSCTGQGEYFIRNCIAHEVASKMKYLNMSLLESCEDEIFNVLEKSGGRGDLIALDKDGNIAMPFNTSGMLRGYIDIHGDMSTHIC